MRGWTKTKTILTIILGGIIFIIGYLVLNLWIKPVIAVIPRTLGIQLAGDDFALTYTTQGGSKLTVSSRDASASRRVWLPKATILHSKIDIDIQCLSGSCDIESGNVAFGHATPGTPLHVSIPSASEAVNLWISPVGSVAIGKISIDGSELLDYSVLTYEEADKRKYL